MSDVQKQLESIYFSPKQGASFTSRNKLIKEVKSKKIKNKEVKDWLQKQNAYTLHRPVVRKFKRSKIITNGLNDLFEADLMDMSNISEENDDITFILVLIDAFSRKLWLKPLKSKHAKTVLKAFREVLEESGKPNRIRTDLGTEFKNKFLKDFFKKEGINHYFVMNETKAAMAERVIRTIKKKMYRYFTHNETWRYIDILDDLVNSYNNTFHSTIKMKPIDVTKKNEFRLWLNLYMDTLTKASEPSDLKIGDKVRASKLRKTFPKGYHQLWSEEYFKINKIINSYPTRYLLKDLLDEDITGSFYRTELQKIKDADEAQFKIEKEIKEREGVNGKEVFVKWKGWPDKFNQWVPVKDVTDL